MEPWTGSDVMVRMRPNVPSLPAPNRCLTLSEPVVLYIYRSMFTKYPM